jgi:hypothetical protein
MQMDVQLYANAVLHPVIQNSRPAGPRARNDNMENKNILLEPRIDSRTCPGTWTSNKCKNANLLFSVWHIVNNNFSPAFPSDKASNIMKMNMESWWNDTDGGNLRYWGTSLSRQWRTDWGCGGSNPVPRNSEILTKPSWIYSSVENTSITM